MFYCKIFLKLKQNSSIEHFDDNIIVINKMFWFFKRKHKINIIYIVNYCVIIKKKCNSIVFIINYYFSNIYMFYYTTLVYTFCTLFHNLFYI